MALNSGAWQAIPDSREGRPKRQSVSKTVQGREGQYREERDRSREGRKVRL